MKTKKLLSLSLLSLLISLPAYSAVEVRFADDAPGVEPVKGPMVSGLISAASADPAIGEQVIIASLCASSSPNVVESRRNAIGGISGASVNLDAENPAGWYVVPAGPIPIGWQWYETITAASFPLWRGDLNTSLVAERGNRLVSHFVGKSPISAYTAKVTTSLTNISETTFAISSGTRRFNPNLVGIKLGANGRLDSTYDVSTGVWTQRSDDTVYSNGENPAETDYDIWIDFGATIVVTANSPASLDGVKNQFIQGSPELNVELMRDGEVVAQSKIMAERPRLDIYRGTVGDGVTQNIMVYLNSGQWDVDYLIQWTESFGKPWAELDTTLRRLGDGFEMSINTELNPFPGGLFRVYSGTTGGINPASARLVPRFSSLK